MREAPGVGVEHRHDRQDDVALAHADGVGQHDGGRVQQRRPVRVDDALRVAGGAARVAHGRGAVLVLDVELDGLGCVEQRFVADDAGVVGDVALAVVHYDDLFHRLERVDHRPEQAHQRPVDEHDLVLGVVGDVCQLVGEQADIEGVQHATRARNGEVELEVTGRVPRERRDARIGREPQRVEDAPEPAGALGPLAIGRALAAGGGRRDDLLVGEQPLASMEQVGQGKRVVLHQALHGASLVGSVRG